LNYIKLSVKPPYSKPLRPILNEAGLPVKEFFETADVCKLLSIIPDTFRQRIHRGFYPEFLKISDKRKYTLQKTSRNSSNSQWPWSTKAFSQLANLS